ncbi:C4-dicarboxylate ABC transporter permease [Aurantimonas sp. Leaf443]|nr:C4-dicarboxylate ABC transporter permease [Aurantimonas sp. Leaf443]
MLPLRALQATSEAVLKVEKVALGALMTLLFALILVNVVTRYARVPLYGNDEASIFAMVWLTFVGASCMTRLRMDFSVTLLTDFMKPAMAKTFKAGATLLVLGFSLALAAMCWLWLDPIGIARAGFDAETYAGESFNFLYTERTQTLEWPTVLVMSIVPIFALTTILHGATNLAEDLGLLPRPQRPALDAGQGVN